MENGTLFDIMQYLLTKVKDEKERAELRSEFNFWAEGLEDKLESYDYVSSDDLMFVLRAIINTHDQVNKERDQLSRYKLEIKYVDRD